MTVVEVDPEDDSRVTVSVSYIEVHMVDQIPGVLNDSKRRLMTAPKTWATWMALQGVFGLDGVEIGPNYGAWLHREWTERVEPCLNLRGSVDVLSDPNTPWDVKLYGYQRAGAAFMALGRNVLLGDDMGTGKTVQTIAAMRRLAAYGHNPFPALMIVPNSTKGQWAEHFEEWFPGTRVVVIDGGAETRRKQLVTEADVYIINWEAVRLHSRLAPYGTVRLKRCWECDHRKGDPELKTSRCEVHQKELNEIEFATVVVDEAHKMKNPESKMTRAAWAVQHAPSVKFRYALTGTPIGDHPGDLWPIMHGLAPEEYARRTDYADRYCLWSFSFRSGGLEIVGLSPQYREEFFGFFDARFRRMPKSLVLPYLPAVVYERRDAPMTPKQATGYKQMRDKLMAVVDDEAGEDDLLVAKSNLAKNTRLLQFAHATCELHGSEVVLKEPSPKLDVMMEVFEEAARPVVVCAESKKLILLASERLEKEGIPHHALVGGLTSDVRTMMLRDLRNGAIRALLFTMKAGGEGLNMTAADTMIRLERSWSMLINHQTMARIHRIGSERHESILIVDVVAPGTIEERQFKVLGEKTKRLEEIVRDKMALRAAGRAGEALQLEREEQAILNSTLLP